MRKIAVFLLIFWAGPALAQTVPVPFVGCPADGQMGPEAAPNDGVTPQLPPAQAKELSYYVSPSSVGTGLSVLAPRGWHCAVVYGSAGTTLVVTPQPITPDDLLGTLKITGPAVQLSGTDGATSGRFAVAQLAARLFPAASSYVARVKAENLAPAADFTPIPYSGDAITRHGDYEADFVTPPHQEGIGTASRLVPGPLAIRGFALLMPNDDFSLLTLSARLPEGSEGLVAPIAAVAKTAVVN